MRTLLTASVMVVTVLTVAPPATAHGDNRGPAAARAVIQRYYGAIDRGDYRTAYLLWSDGGHASGTSYARFRLGFAATAHTRVNTGTPINGDAAMGSVYIDVPVDVRAVLKNGVGQHFRGRYTLRRVNGVDGATASQLNWHISAAELRKVR